MDFLKENWIWIVAPVVTVLIVLTLLLIMGGTGGGDDFVYSLN